jgi:hypothetical protein
LNRIFCIIVAALSTLPLLADGEVKKEREPVPIPQETREDPDEIVLKYVMASQGQSARLNGMSMDVLIDGRLPKLKKAGKMSALRKISKVGEITYKVINFWGDDTVKNELIKRFLTAESQAKEDTRSIAITPENYKFKYKGLQEFENQQIHRFELKPKKKRVGLFEGELWVDAKTYLPLREQGRFKKNPSIFLKKVEFVREYEIRDGVAIPKRLESRADTRVVGGAELTIEYANLQKQSEVEPVEEARHLQ